MSIYSTQWRLRFPRFGDDYPGCDWIDVYAQAVPAHIGSPTPGNGYEDGDPYASFLPPALECDPDYRDRRLRAVVFVTSEMRKGTRSPQEYDDRLLVVTGAEYASITFDDLYERICDALRGDRPRRVGEFYKPGNPVKVFFEDGTTKDVPFE